MNDKDIKIVSVDVMRASDAWTIANKIPSKELMRRAGKGIFDNVKWEGPVAIACGKGNNAGDGYVVADLLNSCGIDCSIFLLEEKFSEDGKYYYDICMKNGIKSNLFKDASDFSGFKMILDCILGTGFTGTVSGRTKEMIDAINNSGAYVISADINSGINGDTGLGETYVISDLTVSIGAFQPGHFIGLADEAMKEKINVDIGIEIRE